MRILLLRAILTLSGRPTWKSWTGFGVTTSWPRFCEHQILWIRLLFRILLPKNYVVEGPCHAAAGALVLYAWPQDDPNLLAAIEAKRQAAAP